MVLNVIQLLGEATEQMSFKLGQTLAGLLNASFGNAVEIIVGIAALMQGMSLKAPPTLSSLIVLFSRRADHCAKLCTSFRDSVSYYSQEYLDARLHSIQHSSCLRLFILGR